ADNGDGSAAALFGAILGTFIPPGGCFTADATGTPTLVENKLDEDNISWSVGLDWHFSDDSMLDGNVSRGFKSGGFPTIAATAVVQYDATTEEELTAYEIGFKSAVNDELQLNGAVFYYDYSDKQVLGFFEDEIFGPILRLVNIPESEVTGAELELQWASSFGLDVSFAGSYLDSEVTSDFLNPNAFGVPTNFKGESFPNAPDTQVNLDAVYRFSLTGNMDVFIGGNVYYQSSTNSEFGESPELDVDSYTLLDLRAGVEAPDGRWKVSAWMRNVNDEYYWTNASKTNDTIIRFTGLPRTYGLSLNWSFGG
ncbi:MAG: TonB-dependent receptor, partial [Pseudomonadota bacterium]